MKKVLLALTLLSLLILSGCGAQKIYFCADGSVGGNQQVTSDKVIYVCPDGREASSPVQCRFTVQLGITQDDAEAKSLSFVKGYVQANFWQSTLVNTYREGDDYKAQIIISKRDEASYETIIIVNGSTGSASCEENCEYVI